MTTFTKIQRRQSETNDRLAEYTGLDIAMVENVVQYAKHIVPPGTEEISLNVFTTQMMNQFHITNQNMILQMYEVLARRKSNSRNRDNSAAGAKAVTIEDYCWCICIFLSQNVNIKIDWVFSVYDTNSDYSLSRLELYLLLKPCALQADDMDMDESVKELVDIVISVFDMDRNGQIDLEEFRNLAKRDVLYIDLLGQCLPSDYQLKKFRKKLENKSPNQVSLMFETERMRTSLTAVTDPLELLYPFPLDMP